METGFKGVAGQLHRQFCGCVFLSFLFVKSGASHQILVDYYNSFLAAKLSAPPMRLFLRGVLCNFCVCLAVLTGTRMKSESGKLIVMFCVIMAFVVSGFEHCVANMGTFSIAYLLFGKDQPGVTCKEHDLRNTGQHCRWCAAACGTVKADECGEVMEQMKIIGWVEQISRKNSVHPDKADLSVN